MHTFAPNKYPRFHKFQISRMKHPNTRPIIPPNINQLADFTGKTNINKNACIIWLLSRCSCSNAIMAVEAPVKLPTMVVNNRNRTWKIIELSASRVATFSWISSWLSGISFRSFWPFLASSNSHWRRAIFCSRNAFEFSNSWKNKD